MSNGKISFSFGANPAQKPATAAQTAAPAPKSNLELLMAKSKAKQPPSKAPPAALFDEEDEEDDKQSSAPPDILAGPSKKRAPVTQAAQLSRAERRAQAAAQAIDQSIFDYDSHYEQMKAAERVAEETKKKESEERKPKYIESFLASAQTRKLDKLRAEEKMLEREREKEGDEFEGKEKFVTEAYKRQMEEVRKAEEEEKAREEALRKGQKGPGLTAFYKTMLDSEESKHAAAVAATSKPVVGPSLAIRPPTEPSKPVYDDEEEYDPFLAREAKESTSESAGNRLGKAGSTMMNEESGKQVEINDEGEVVDKRSLLKAGLNITKKPKAEIPNSLLTSQRSGQPSEGPYVSRAVGAAAGYKERMERERRRLAEQMREVEERKRKEEEEKLRREEEEARRRREGENGEAERKRAEARERYLARKREREEAEKVGNKKAKEE
ncbi:hypothetical protein I305_02141 [Cryptococcus gattii E566]|uniref:Nuclear speckle splicing regulatory protein 1 N-terminal domain-containing protein n=2 Tax=Cryptococcus gattii TaxID=37769 RepID=E6RDC6_CRYGW|nr:Hypothetical protein CGB_K1310C [Cryptococcus gattii WM276]ADV24869.1 Hypothetical protein CGB_K1310C [Cryptococcus gattii WM276]KIR79302.1 hypothetical protein I306_03721 [Cryptococcus gattii EJB2]KIY35235.1 hypothetical protein I305_02141 [Cryptococcus gattii E566]KJE05699.1 hypothetical protein I311_00424 [Cryptococcus gattii NT-10]